VVQATRVVDPGFFIMALFGEALYDVFKESSWELDRMNRQLISDLWVMIEPVVGPEGIELVELEFRPEGGRWVLRLYVDTPGGVTLEDCELVSRQVGALLDIKNPIERPYTLEVSSPGINRVIRRKKDFNLFAGLPVCIRTRRKLEGRRNFSGTLKGTENSRIVLEIDGTRVEIDLEEVDKARLDLPEEDLLRRDLRKGAARTGEVLW
jgi:ribosome maturation factor RimP